MIWVSAIWACQGPDRTNIPDPTDGPVQAVDVTASAPVVCPDPGARTAAPFDTQLGEWEDADPTYRFDGGGVVVADLDGDGHANILVLRHETIEHYEYDPLLDTLVLVPGWYEGDADQGYAGAAADYDADGDVDVFVSRYDRPDLLLDNDGAGHFIDVAPSLGVEGPADHKSSAAAWSDIDNDGDLDLYVGGHLYVRFDASEPQPYPAGDPDFLYLNQGDGTFVDGSDRLPFEVHDGYAMAAAFVDLDDDGWHDLIVANDFGNARQPSNVMWNRDGHFVPDDGTAGLTRTTSAMGIGIGDVNEDGLWDVVMPAWGNFDFMQSSAAAGVWLDQVANAGIQPDLDIGQLVAWGGALADMDNDTDLDLLVAFGFLRTAPLSPVEAANGLWLQDQGSFVSATRSWGTDEPTASRGFVTADVDRDGWLDWIVPNLEGATRFHRSRCGDANWLEVRLDWPVGHNRAAIGAVVAVQLGERTLRRPVMGGGTSYGSSGPSEVHFGLGDHERVDAVVIEWPDGAHTVLDPQASNRRLTVTRAD